MRPPPIQRSNPLTVTFNMKSMSGAITFVTLAAILVLSQFFRASIGVIAPELARDVGLTPEALGLASGAFFLAVGVMQIPVGMLFDRFGPRRTVAGLSLLAIAGALLHAAAQDAVTIVVARLLLGVGCAGNFMAVVVIYSRAHKERLASLLGRAFAASQIGILMAATPLAAASETIGWRWAFVGSAAFTAAATLLYWHFIDDGKRSGGASGIAVETAAEVARGVLEAIRTPGLIYLIVLQLFAYAAISTMMGLWAGPYLHDVHGLDPVSRGNVIMAMGGAQVVGMLCYGSLDRVFNTRKGVVAGGAAASIIILSILAMSARTPAWMAISLLISLGFFAAYSPVLLTHGRSLFPDRLAGRGVTLVNLAQVAGSALMPALTGLIVGNFPTETAGRPEIAYRLAFGAIGAALALGLAVYFRARDVKPDSTR